MLTLSFVQLEVTENALLSSVIRGANPSGLGAGVMVRKSGQEWLQYLPTLGHCFGDDGQFVMECEDCYFPHEVLALKHFSLADTDWLEAFSQIDRTLFFDETWTMSSQWLEVTCPSLPSAWSYGEVSCKSF